MASLNLDKFNNIDPDMVGQGGMNILNVIQHLPKEVQVHAVAAAFLMIAYRNKLNAQDIFTATRNMLNEASHEAPGLRAMRMYVHNGLE